MSFTVEYMVDGEWDSLFIPNLRVSESIPEFDSYELALAEIQAELVSVSLEYAGSVASDIYIYGSTADDAMFFDPFFVVDGQVIRKHKLPGVDASPERQKALVNYGNQQIYRLFLAARELGKRPPRN